VTAPIDIIAAKIDKMDILSCCDIRIS